MNNVFIKTTERDWVEDFKYENGQYQCDCIYCNKIFIGHKRKNICKKCAKIIGWFIKE